MRREFAFHKLNKVGINNSVAIANAFGQLLDNLELQLGCDPNTREFSIVKTKLEEACFFAKKSMAVRHDMQDRDNKLE